MKINTKDVLIVFLGLLIATGWLFAIYQFERRESEERALITGLYLLDEYYVLEYKINHSPDPAVANEYRQEQQETLRQIHEQAIRAGSDLLPETYLQFLDDHPINP